ncbi:MAG: aspartate--tRNA ligase [Planctomycetota bacterium]|jgi:aspartyl-tRNA synthetase
MHPYRTHTCGELRASHVGEKVRLSGWVHLLRHHGGVLFVNLRDHYGITQMVVRDPTLIETMSDIRFETVLTVDGTVRSRGEQVNPSMETGEIEVEVETFREESASRIIPFQVSIEEDTPESIRLTHRYIDLRRDRLHKNIVLRSDVCQFIRAFLHEKGWHEIHTPILTRSSPEGARDYVVPSRVHPGRFYALPQAPQQFKQLLMISGFDRYFQIAPCFRDEDARADRSPGEFYQIDLEMAFCTQEDVFESVEALMIAIFERFTKKPLRHRPFPRIPYEDCMERYGSDKPDLRNPLTLFDATEVFRDSAFRIFADPIASGGVVLGIRVPGGAKLSRKFFNKLDADAKRNEFPGVIQLSVKEGKPAGRPAKFMGEEGLRRLLALSEGADGDAFIFSAGEKAGARKLLGWARNTLGEKLDLIDHSANSFLWVVDFPMFEWDEELRKWDFSHNPFSMPQGGKEALEASGPGEILAYQYDLVCNGIELSSGAIRNHRPDIMMKAFEIAGYDPDRLKERFPALWNAFHYGPPPHGGIAPGIDRILMILSGEKNIREVIAFPFNQQAQDLMMGAPSALTPSQLKELHITTLGSDRDNQ